MMKAVIHFLKVDGNLMKHGEKYKVKDSQVKNFHPNNLECLADIDLGAYKVEPFVCGDSGVVFGKLIPSDARKVREGEKVDVSYDPNYHRVNLVTEGSEEYKERSYKFYHLI
jgi:hypothetical protein